MDSLRTVMRLVRADLVKLTRYWVVVAGYGSMLGFAILGAFVAYYAERTVAVTSSSGWDFAFSLMFRYLDFGSMILFVMLCILFAIEVSNSTIKVLLTRSVTRTELIVSKHVTAGLMTLLCVGLLWCVALCAGWYTYGLGSLTENEYVIFSSSYMCAQILICTCFLLIPFAALASLALMVSTFSSTMGGAIVVGLILYLLSGTLGVVPASLGIPFEWTGQERVLPIGAVSLPGQILVPMYSLADLPTGIPIDRWWSWDIQKMTFVSVVLFSTFFCVSLVAVRKRDFTL